MVRILRTVAALSTITVLCCAEVYDPIDRFCSRWQHASVVKGNTLYMDGGVQTYAPDGFNYSTKFPGRNILGINDWVITVPVDVRWNWWTNLTEGKIAKRYDSKTGINPFNGTVRAALFQGPPDQRRIYSFGGASFMHNTSFPGWWIIQSSINPLWHLDLDTNVWTPHPTTLTSQPNYGHAAEAVDKGLAFYLNGQTDQGTHQNLGYMGNRTQNLPGMVVINLNNQTFANISTPGLPSETYPRVGGNLQYIPNIGRSGVLVSLGGAYGNYPNMGRFDSQKLATFDTVDIFDLDQYLGNPKSNGSWYSQRCEGDIPPPRIDTCFVLKSAPDNSSHTLYMYGGRDPMLPASTNEPDYGIEAMSPQGKLYDDIYMLSIPSFIWTKSIVGESPRWGHTCHAVGNRQMITTGGSLNKTLESEGCDWEYRGVAIYDLTTSVWSGELITDTDPYGIPKEIVAKIGGTASGNASVRAPPGGWSNATLANVLGLSPVPEKSKTSTGTIVGAVIGSVVGAAVIGGAIFFYIRRRRSKPDEPDDPPAELSDSKNIHEANPDEKLHEAEGKQLAFELEASHGLSEATPTQVVAELSPDTVSPGGRPGIPVLRVNNRDNVVHDPAGQEDYFEQSAPVDAPENETRPRE